MSNWKVVSSILAEAQKLFSENFHCVLYSIPVNLVFDIVDGRLG